MNQTPSIFSLMRAFAAADYLSEQLFSPVPVMFARPSYGHRAYSLVTAVATLQAWMPDSAGAVSSVQVERMRCRWWERQLVSARARLLEEKERLLSAPPPSAPHPSLSEATDVNPVVSSTVVDLLRARAAAECLIDSILRGMSVRRTRLLAFGLPGNFDGLVTAVSPYMSEHPGRTGPLSRERDRASWWEPQLEEALRLIMKLQREKTLRTGPSPLP